MKNGYFSILVIQKSCGYGYYPLVTHSWNFSMTSNPCIKPVTTNNQRNIDVSDHGIPARAATLAAAVSAHWIVPSNPMGGTVYEHTRPCGQRLARTKTKGGIFYLIISIRGARDAASHEAVD